jgi:hypothetical protein
MPPMNTILFGHRVTEPAAYARGLASQLWRRRVDLTSHGHAAGAEAGGNGLSAALADALKRDEQVIALDAVAMNDPAVRQSLADAADAQRIYLRCRPDALALRCGDANEAAAFTRDVDPLCAAAADKVFDASELQSANGLRHLIRQCL